MFEAYEYIPSEHFIDLLEEYRTHSECKSRGHGYTCLVKRESQSQSFAVIKEGEEETYVYYDTQAARKRTQLHPKNGREYEIDHVSNRIADPEQSPHLAKYVQQHEDRLVQNRDEAPDASLSEAFGKDENKQLYDVTFGNKTTVTEAEIRDAFRTEVEERRHSLNADDLGDSRHDQFEKMFGWRIEPLEKRVQPDIVLELILFGAYIQVANTIDSV